MTLRPGDSEPITLSSYFSDPEGGDLTYAVTSSASDNVTATESGGTLTLEAMMVGTAMIMVDATDDADNMVSDTFTVTVDTGCEPSVALDVNTTYKCTLSLGYWMQSRDSSKVHVAESATANEWVITASLKVRSQFSLTTLLVLPSMRLKSR